MGLPRYERYKDSGVEWIGEIPVHWEVRRLLDKTQIGYEVSFNRYFYRHTPLRSLEEVTAEILALEAETEGLVKRLVSFGREG